MEKQIEGSGLNAPQLRSTQRIEISQYYSLVSVYSLDPRGYIMKITLV